MSKFLTMMAMILAMSGAAFAADKHEGHKAQKDAPAAASADEGTSASGTTYPLDVCPVSGMKLGSMGEPVTKVIDGREVKFCCDGCPGKFEKDKVTYNKKMDKAIVDKQKKDYPLTTCVVSGDKLGSDGEAINYVYKNQLVRLCCPDCVDSLKKNPEKYLKQIDDARKAKSAEKPAMAAEGAKKS